MSDATCATCPYFDEFGTTSDGFDGVCRRSTPTAVRDVPEAAWGGIWPGVFDSDWCGEHPERSTAPSGTSLLDVWRDVFNRWAEVGHPDAFQCAADAVKAARLATEGEQ